MNEMLDALGSRPRRQLLLHLAERNPRNETEQVDELDFYEDEAAFVTRLHHTELPKLDEMGYISWDRETGEIVTGPEFPEICPLVRLMAVHEDELPDGWI